MNTPQDGTHTDAPAGFRIVDVSRVPIELYKILKFEGMTESGGGAKAAVASGRVLVNGEIETRKRKQILSGDTIEFDEDKIFIRFCPSSDSDVGPAAAQVKRAPKQEKIVRSDGSALTRRIKKP
jgi:ribosome-associated protein